MIDAHEIRSSVGLITDPCTLPVSLPPQYRDAAFTNLMKLLRATSELDLIMYVMKKGRVSTADTACYELLVNKVAHGLRHSGGEIGTCIRSSTNPLLPWTKIFLAFPNPGLVHNGGCLYGTVARWNNNGSK